MVDHRLAVRYGFGVAGRQMELAAGDWAVLGAIAEGPTHGFAIAPLLAEDGPLGQVWTLPRPMVYQALRKLLAQGLVKERSTERSARGPERTIVAITPAGRRALERWLTRPVEHVRDVRTLFLLKLALLYRSGADARPLLEAQKNALVRLQEVFAAAAKRSEGFDRLLMQWRLSSSRAAVTFISDVLDALPPRV